MAIPRQKLPELSVFFPCYNEEKNITNTVNKALPIIKAIATKWEVILVNDGSTDATLAVLTKLVHRYGSNVRIVNHPKNRGYGAAFKSGFYSAKYRTIAFTDADGQFNFEDIYKFIEAQTKTQADLVIGYYLGRKVPIYRKIGSTLWQLAVFLLFGLKVRDIDCGFKLVNKVVIDRIPKLEAERGPFITSEFLIKATKQGFSIAEVGVRHYARQAGAATGSKLDVVLAGFKDLIRLWKKLNFS